MSSAVNPLAFSLMSDFFPPEKRSTANSVISSGNFIGIALSSMTILLIKSVGWRASYVVMGLFGMFGALGATLFLKNPPRGRFDPIPTPEEKEKSDAKEAAKPKGFGNFMGSMSELNDDPVCKNVFWAGSIRSFGSAIVTAFIPVYFQQAFPEFKS